LDASNRTASRSPAADLKGQPGRDTVLHKNDVEVGERVLSSAMLGQTTKEVVEKIEGVVEGALAADAQIVQPFRRERVVTSHIEPRQETVELYRTHNELVSKVIPTPVPSEKVTMKEVEETINVTVKVQEPVVTRVNQTVEVPFENEIVELVEVERTIPVKVMVKEARVKKVANKQTRTVSTDVVKMQEVEKVVAVKIRKMVPNVEKVTHMADVKIEYEKPVIEKIQEQRQRMEKVTEVTERMVPDGPASLRAIGGGAAGAAVPAGGVASAGAPLGTAPAGGVGKKF